VTLPRGPTCPTAVLAEPIGLSITTSSWLLVYDAEVAGVGLGQERKHLA